MAHQAYSHFQHQINNLCIVIFLAGYPIVWGLAEGANVITAQAEAASYAGLDIAAKVFFGWAIMLGLNPLHKVQEEEEAA